MGLAKLVILIAAVMRCQLASGDNILGLFTSHSPSHLIIHMSVAQALAEKGHNVTVVSMLPPQIKHPNMHSIIIPATPEQRRIFEEQLTEMVLNKYSVFRMIVRLVTSLNVIFEQQYDALRDPRFDSLYGSQKFDLMILGYYMNDFQMGVAAKFKCPIVVNWIHNSMPMLDALVGNPLEISYVPHATLPFKSGQTRSFTTRLENFGLYCLSYFLERFYQHQSENYYRKLFAKEQDFPSLAEMQRNISLLFLSSHSPSEGRIRPLVPATIEIGGIQIKQHVDPLPENVDLFLNNASAGAILFSLGAMVRSSTLKAEIIEILYTTFASLTQYNIIWKWENSTQTPGNASNIMYANWLPQADILSHRNLKLFITHAGRGSITEAQYHGVPMLALPILGDQLANAANIALKGHGLTLELVSLQLEEFKSVILEILQNPKYSREVKQFSKLYRDRPLTPKQNVVFWTDYVLRHRGAPHLQSAAVHMSYLEYYNLDVYTFLLGISFIIIVSSVLVIRFLWRKLRKLCKHENLAKQKTN